MSFLSTRAHFRDGQACGLVLTKAASLTLCENLKIACLSVSSIQLPELSVAEKDAGRLHLVEKQNKINRIYLIFNKIKFN